jgi:hypothetical protein
VFVLGVVASLVLLTLNLFRDGDTHPPERATTSAATASETPAAGTERRNRSRGAGSSLPSAKPAGPTAPALAEPEGECRAEDVVVSPVVDDAVAGSPVTITLRLRTLSSPACTWELAARDLALKITDGGDELWASRECPGAIEHKDVVVRRQVVSTATVTWNARRSEPGCPRDPRWVLPGTYDIYAATLGGEPVASSFELTKPEPEVVQTPVTPPRTSPTTSNRGRSRGR